MKKPVIYKDIKFTKIIGGGRALGELENGKKVLAWGVLPGEIADIKQIKKALPSILNNLTLKESIHKMKIAT